MKNVIDEYLAKVQPEHRVVLEGIRQLIHEMLPDVEETMSYGMPAFKFQGQNVVWIGSFKQHMSLFPTGTPIGKIAHKLDGFTISKGTIQFTVEKPLPDEIIKEIIQIRLDALNKP